MAKGGLLARYNQKRDFTKTPEPEGVKKAKAGRRYLIQKHAATRLHYDFRLELGGVLKSWAVTRGPSLDPHEKRLAVEVEDHPVSYGSFEGTIPKGQYGGGTVMLWDEGTWEPVGDPHEGLEKGKLVFKLHGERLTGEWTLVRMRPRGKDNGRNNWLLIKHTDEVAHAGDTDKLLTRNMTSVVSGRTMEKIAAAEDRVWSSGQAKPKQADTPAVKKAAQKGMPKFIPPQLATLTDAMPQGREWVHEIKFDGYRGLAYMQNKTVRIYTRTGQDWTHKFSSLAGALGSLPVKSAILDGEIVALKGGKSSFMALQNALSEGKSDALQYYVFDLLYLNGDDLTKRPLLERKEKLKTLLKAKPLKDRVFFSDHFAARDDAVFRNLCDQQMEGVISKQAGAPYRSGRGMAWLKTKCHRRQEFVIGGFTLPTHAKRGVGALLVGYFDKEKLVYAGKVGTGFDNETSLRLRGKLDALAQKSAAFGSVPADGRRGAKWVKPTLVCEVEFTEWTDDGRLRHPSFQGLREDKPAQSITRDVPFARAQALRSETGKKAQAPAPKEAKNKKGRVEIGGIAVSHPDRVIFPGTSLTKAELAEYYLEVADYILPHVAGRPLSMLRCPEGIGEECFFQRHIPHGQSPHLHNTGINVKGRAETYMMIKDARGLITLAQWGVIELHPWGCLADKPELPDRIVFDLDPDGEVPRAHVIEAANEVRIRMQELGLTTFVKTTGGKGLHVVVPMTRAYGWKTVKAFAKAIADSMEHDNPKRYLSKSSKAARKGKIFVDYLRNDLTSTAVAAFSARAREGATVAMPLAWEELKTRWTPLDFTIETVPGLLKKRRHDPWKEFFTIRQKIAAKYLQALKISAE